MFLNTPMNAPWKKPRLATEQPGKRGLATEQSAMNVPATEQHGMGKRRSCASSSSAAQHLAPTQLQVEPEQLQDLSSVAAKSAAAELASRVFQDHTNLYHSAVHQKPKDWTPSADLPPGNLARQLHSLLRANKALLQANADETETFRRCKSALHGHMAKLYSLLPATEQEHARNMIAHMLDTSMQEHCWQCIAEKAEEIQCWALAISKERSKDVTAQLAFIKEQYSRPNGLRIYQHNH